MLTTEATAPAAEPEAPAATLKAPEAAAAPALTTEPATGPTWEDMTKGLPEDLRDDPSMTSIKNLEALAKSYVSSQKMLGKDKIPIPDPKHATQDDYLGIFKKLGAVENVEDFKFNLPEGVAEGDLNAETMSALKEAAVKTGVLPWQFEQIFGAYMAKANEGAAKTDESIKAKQEEDSAILKKEWGEGFNDQVGRANVAFRELVPDAADRDRLVKEGLGSHPVVLKLLANASKYFKEDQFLGQGEGALAGYTPESALQKAREIQGNPDHPYRNERHPNHKAAKQEVANLYKAAYPE